MAEQLEATVKSANQKVQFIGTVKFKPPITMDYTPPLGDGHGYTSLELLLMSFANCAASTIVPLLRRMRKTITDCTVQAKGIRREEHPTGFRTIHLDFVITSPDVIEADVQKAIQLSEQTYCPVWAMIKGNVEITTTVTMKK
jgi:putative redox protein